MTQEQKDYINAKISEALSTSLGGDWEKEFDAIAPQLGFNPTDISQSKALEIGSSLKRFFAAEKEKVESEIKSALETIDWGDEIK